MKKYLIGTILIFALTFSLGLFIAKNKPLWNDEIYSLISSIQNLTYQDILLGKAPEGNVAPLFYLLQKTQCDVAHYKTFHIWEQGHLFWWVPHKPSQTFLRLQPIFFMSLSVASIFFYFFRCYGFLWGIFSILTVSTSFIFWYYIAEARHYSLWFFLSTAQALLYVYLLKNNLRWKIIYRWLVATHLLLSVTVIFSVVQIFWVSVMLWFFNPKIRAVQSYFLLTILPIVIALWYYTVSPHNYYYIFPDHFMSLIYNSLPKVMLFVLMAYGALCLVRKNRYSEGKRIILFFLSLFLSAIFLVLWLKFGPRGNADQPFNLDVGRYFIFIAPIGFIAFVYSAMDLWQSEFLKKRSWLQLGVPIIYFGIIIFLYLNNKTFLYYYDVFTKKIPG